MTDIRSRLADALVQRLAEHDYAMSQDTANDLIGALLSLPGITIADSAEQSIGRHSLDDDLIEDGRYVMWFDHGTDCPWVGCPHGWIRSGTAANAVKADR